MVWQKQISSTSPNVDYMKRNYADDKLIKGDLAGEKNGKSAPRMGSKVKTIASIFQSMTPNSTANQFKKISENNGSQNVVSKANSSPRQTNSPKSNDSLLNSRRKTFPSELEMQQQKHLASVKNNLINLNKTRELENGKENEKNLKKGSPLNDRGLAENRKTRIESRVNRFNNAKAIFEKMESTGVTQSPKFSNGKVSPPKEQPVSSAKVTGKLSNNLFSKKTSDDLPASPASPTGGLASLPSKPHTSLISSNQHSNHHDQLNNDCSSNSSPLHHQQTSSSFSNFNSSTPNQITKPARVTRPDAQPPAHKSKDELLDKVICELASDSHDITMDFNKLVNNSQNFLFQKNDVNLNELCDTSGISEILDRFENNKYDEVDLMTEEEANKLLCKSLDNNGFSSNSNSAPSSPVKQPNKIDSLKSQFESECSKVNGTASQLNGNHILPSFLQKKDSQLSKSDVPDYAGPDESQPDQATTAGKPVENEIIIEDVKYHVFSDGNFYFEKETENDDLNEVNLNRKVRFDTKKVKVYSTYTWAEYGKLLANA